MRKSNRILGFAAASIGILMLATTAFAADLRFDTASKSKSFVVSAQETVRNLYTGAGQLIVNANVGKDLVAAGGIVNINGSTADDLIVAGGNIDIRGPVGGSARIAGGQINVEGTIGEDLVVAGGTVYISPSASVGGDVLIVGGSVTIDGPVTGNIRVSGGSLNINSVIQGNIFAKVGNFNLEKNADIRGSVNYSSQHLLTQDGNAKIAGQVNYTQLKSRGNKIFGVTALFLKILTELVAALLLYLLLKRRYTQLALESGQGFWKKTLLGLAGLIVIPIVSIILFITLIGIYSALILLAFYVLMVLIAYLVSVGHAGAWLLSKINGKPVRFDYIAIAFGLVVVWLIQLVPFLGALVILVLLCNGVGTLLMSTHGQMKRQSPQHE